MILGICRFGGISCAAWRSGIVESSAWLQYCPFQRSGAAVAVDAELVSCLANQFKQSLWQERGEDAGHGAADQGALRE
jgi:hypothetical protein